MLKLKMDHYATHTELTEFLKSAVKSYPHLMTLESIGKTTGKKEIWLATITNSKTGSAENKPAFWIDGNTHASEVAGAQSAMFFISRLLAEAKTNSEIQYLLDHVTFYVLPKLSADGADYFIRTQHEVRSSLVPWPNPPVHENFIPADLNGDGLILTMRKEDPAGAYKVSPKNKKIMVQRSHVDYEDGDTKYYKLYQEGSFQNFDGFNENFEQTHGYDLNRQYPANYRPEGQQMGAGEYPLQLPEAEAFVKAFTERKRIYGHLTLHTYGGVIIRPPTNHPDENFAAHDIEVYKKILEENAIASGYKPLSSY
ncbi:MAG: M14 family metallopeptidase, partial [Pseudobdellovibrionaceae bacterium]